jgi:hypothetical protein
MSISPYRVRYRRARIAPPLREFLNREIFADFSKRLTL